MENLKQLYLEHEQRVTDNLPEIKHVDLWAEQVGFLAEEHPFKTPAVFFAYRILNANDQGQRVQQLRMQVDVYIFYETFADSKRGSKMQNKALGFLDLLTKINACFQGGSGNYFSEMRRTGFNPVETGTAALLYVQRYECSVNDASAQALYNNMKFENMEVDVVKDQIDTGRVQSSLYDQIN
ncbi:MAG: hypothetical protein V7767_05195 [Leeuwenhoekiella sp.]